MRLYYPFTKLLSKNSVAPPWLPAGTTKMHLYGLVAGVRLGPASFVSTLQSSLTTHSKPVFTGYIDVYKRQVMDIVLYQATILMFLINSFSVW